MQGICVRARGLQKQYGTFEAVRGVDFDVPCGVCFGFLGPNGAGKTSVMKMLYGANIVTGGTLEVLGMDPRVEARAIKRRLGVVPQEENLDLELTVRENLTVYARYHDLTGRRAAERIDELLRFFALADKRDARVETLSGGLKRRLLLARGLLNGPEIVILDEPTTGLDPQARHVLWEKLRALRGQGVALILTTHYMDEAEKLCDELVLMDEGRIVARGTPRQLILEHLPSDVLEVRLPAREREALRPGFSPRIEARRDGDEVGCFFTREPAELLQEMVDLGVPPGVILSRPANLEDVFLKLTGHGLSA